MVIVGSELLYFSHHGCSVKNFEGILLIKDNKYSLLFRGVLQPQNIHDVDTHFDPYPQPPYI